MQTNKYFISVIFPTILLFSSLNAYSSNGTQSWAVKKSDNIIITIDDDSVLRGELTNGLFSFNINYISFQQQLWDRKSNSVNSKVIKNLIPFSGSRFRYPGGIVANNVDWAGIVGPINKRKPQKSYYHRKPVLIRFGIDEYLNFVETINGKPWYVLNLVGINALDPLRESDKKIVAKHNRQLAEYLKPKLTSVPHYYQLGNELDRAKYEWPPEKYVQRSAETIRNMLEVDDDARFVAFLRGFNWKYKKNPERGVSKPYDLMKVVLDGLPMVTDYSLHHYYDGKRDDGKSLPVPFWIRKINESIDNYKEIRDGKSPSVWITEHARQKSSNSPGKDKTRFYVSNLGGSISTADYLIALTQIPEVKGAFLHGLNAGPWQMFDKSVNHKDLRPLPILETMTLLRNTSPTVVLETQTQSTNNSKYRGGYDVRAAGFRNNASDQLAIWVVNRASKAQEATIVYTPFSGQEVRYSHRYVAGKDGVDADDLKLTPTVYLDDKLKAGKFSGNGEFVIMLPPSSISNILILKNN